MSRIVKWKESTYAKIIAFFIFILLILLLIGIFTIKWSSDQLSAKIVKAAQTQNAHYLSQVAQDMERIQSLQISLLEDIDVDRLSKASILMNNYQKTQAVVRVCQRLTTIKNSSEYIENVRVYIPDLGWSLNSEGTAGGSYSEISQEQYLDLAGICPRLSSFLVSEAHSLQMLLSQPSKKPQDPPYFIVQINLSRNKLADAFRSANAYGNSLFSLRFGDADYFRNDVKSEFDSPEIRHAVENAASQGGEYRTTIQGVPYIGVYEASSFTGMSILQFLPQEEILLPLRPLTYLAFTFFLLLVLFAILYAFATYRLINVPIKSLITAFQTLEKGDFGVILESQRHNDFEYVYRSFNHMVKRLKILMDSIAEQKNLVQKAELKQLQSQINPHFLYNSYFLLHRLIKSEDYDNAVVFSKNMGSYFQFVTRSAADIVPLEKEYAHAKIYIDIQAMRFAGRIEVDAQALPPEIAGTPVPRLILQPLIENAFEHSLENKQSDGVLRIRFNWDNSAIYIQIADNGTDLSDSALQQINHQITDYQPGQETTALININRRIQLFCGLSSGLNTTRSDLGGLSVTVKIEQTGKEAKKCIDC